MAEVLFSDTFTVGANSWNVSAENTNGRQSGTLAPLTYIENAANDYQSQVGHDAAPGQVLLVGVDWWQNSGISPNHSFVEIPGVGQAMSISFDTDPVIGGGGTSGVWTALRFGGSASNAVNDAAAHFALLVKDDGTYEAFDGSTQISTGVYSAAPTTIALHRIEAHITGVGDGNPWDGSGDAQIALYADNSATPFYSYTKADGYTSNYVSLIGGGNWNNNAVDNLTIATVPVPEPTMIGLAGLAVLGLCARWRQAV